MRERESHGRLNIANVVIRLFMQKRNGHASRLRSEKLMGGKSFGRGKKCYSEEDICSTDKTGLFCNTTPDETFKFEDDKRGKKNLRLV